MLNALLVATFLAVTLPPEPANHISDQAQLLTASENAALSTLFQDAQNTRGVKLGLITLTELDDQPKIVAVRTLNYWNMSPDSVMVLVSLNPKKIYIQPGENLQYAFNEATSTTIARMQIAPGLKSGNFGAGILNGFNAIVNTLPATGVSAAQQRRATPQQPQARQEPLRADPVEIVAPAPAQHHGHPFLVFLLLAGGVAAVALIFRAIRRNSQTARTGGYTPNVSSGYDPYTGVRRGSSVASGGGGGGTTVVNNVGGSSGSGVGNLATGMLLGEMLAQPRVVERERVSAPAPTYTPDPVPAPEPSRSKGFLESLSESLGSSGGSSSGGGGGGSSWGSSSSDSSSGSGGGGSSWGDSGSSSSGGGDSGGGGGGGGGSDW